jgi:hypothetical protein
MCRRRPTCARRGLNAVAAGRIINTKTARQMMRGIARGIRMAR